METILVTGGAGFIGSCFVRQCIAEQTCRVVNLDKLTYAGNLDSLRPVENDPRYVFVHGDIADRADRRRVLAEYEPDGDRPFRGRVARRSLDRRPRRVRPHERAGHVPDARRRPALPGASARRAAGGLPLPARLDRRGLRLAGADGPVHRDEPLRPQFALFGVEGGRRPFRPGVLPHLRPAGAGDQLLEQLRPLPVSREADSADDPQRAGGQAAAGLRRRAERPRLAVRRGPLPGAVARA